MRTGRLGKGNSLHISFTMAEGPEVMTRAGLRILL